jgi:hypothetical protein
MNYGMVARDDNLLPYGTRIGGRIGDAPDGECWLTFDVEGPDVEAPPTQAERLGATRRSSPDQVMESLVIGQFTDPTGTEAASRRTAPPD